MAKKRTKKFVSKRAAMAPTSQLRSIYDSRVIVSADRTPSGRRYDFEPGQALLVLDEDLPILLNMKTSGGGCCGGGSTTDPQHYFSEV